MAAGEYDQRVELHRQDELGTLAASFTHMASQVREARAELERQFGEARSLAAELAHTNDVLEHAIREAERSRAEAQQASRAKSEFLATMSHEIRTPINAMIGYTDLLELGVAGPLNETQQHQLTRIRASGRHLIGLVDEVLDLAGVESGRIRIEPRDGRIEDAVGTALAIVQPQAMGKQIEVSVSCRDDDGTPYRGDPRRVEQILVNLLTNAVKFTPSGGAIRIECGPVYEGDARWSEVVVEDSGPGVDPSLHEHIFEPFVQADAGYTRAHGGVGLGLAISRRLARMMAGDITLDVAPGTGARFRVRLPSEAEEPEAARSA
jgi:signal transduction histidine kinase